MFVGDLLLIKNTLIFIKGSILLYLLIFTNLKQTICEMLKNNNNVYS